MSLLAGFVTAIGPALFLLTGAIVLRRLITRPAPGPRPAARGRSLLERRRRHVGLPLATAAVGALAAAISLGADRAVDRGWALMIMGAAIGSLVGILAVASFDEADALGAVEEGWGPPADDTGAPTEVG